MFTFQTQRRARALSGSLAVALLAIGGCAGDGPPPDVGGDLYSMIQRTIFDRRCLGAGCHNSQAQAGAMDLTAANSYADLVDVPPDNPVARARGLLRVVPNDPARSFLLVKLTGPAPGEGSRMPLGQDPLSASDIDLITQWIAAGALPPGTGTPSPLPTASGQPTSGATSTATAAAPTDTPTATPPPPATATVTVTVTGTPPATATPTATPTDSPSPSPTGTPGLFADVQAIFNRTCLDVFCHDQASHSGNLVLVEGESYAQLVDVPPDNFAARNAGLLRVAPGAPDDSFLVVKVEGPPPIMGSRMPLLKPPLTAEEILTIREWIEAGAPPN